MPIQLQFEEVASWPYPYTWPNASGTGLTACRYGGDPAIAFVTQSGDPAIQSNEPIVYLTPSLSVANEMGRLNLSVGTPLWAVRGMAYNRWSGNIYATTPDGVGAFEPETGTVVNTVSLPTPDAPGARGALAFNWGFLVRGNEHGLDAFSLTGVPLGTSHVGTSFGGVSGAGWGFLAADMINHKLLVLGPLGGIIAECSALPGTPLGIDAVAYDDVSTMATTSMQPTPDGIHGPVGSPTHPDTPWNPAPWLFRHRIYLANQSDSTIHVGYLYA